MSPESIVSALVKGEKSFVPRNGCSVVGNPEKCAFTCACIQFWTLSRYVGLTHSRKCGTSSLVDASASLKESWTVLIAKSSSSVLTVRRQSTFSSMRSSTTSCVRLLLVLLLVALASPSARLCPILPKLILLSSICRMSDIGKLGRDKPPFTPAANWAGFSKGASGWQARSRTSWFKPMRCSGCSDVRLGTETWKSSALKGMPLESFSCRCNDLAGVLPFEDSERKSSSRCCSCDTT
mmetsp:Transcript_48530/g.113780  ORF Transcript_48530/g.113780 Transcript_48530/m.113780 type:complete len:237 (-) Transcript_48530:986-1696(-)